GEPVRANCVLLASVDSEKVRWLWPGRIPRGKLVILDGDPGLGKSTIALDIAAKVSTGTPFPDGFREREPAGVVITSAEDGLADTIRPRLESAHADLDRIVAITGVPDEPNGERPLSIPADVPRIEEAIRQTSAALLIIDPLMAFLSGDLNSHRDQDVRRALHSLSSLAERTGAAVIIIRHLNKSGGPNPVYRGGGSIGIIGAARVGLLVAKDPGDGTKRVLAVTKSNLAAEAPSLAYKIDTDPTNHVSRIEWLGLAPYEASDLLRDQGDGARNALDEACGIVGEILADGPVPAAHVKKEALSAGVSEKTLNRAKHRLGIKPKKVGRPGESSQAWVWALPPEDGQKASKMVNPEGWPSSGRLDHLRSHDVQAAKTSTTSARPDEATQLRSCGEIARRDADLP
ncbi:MAG: AAA family ATPase, partial [bacterium]